MKKIIPFTILSLSFFAYAFDWPQESVTKDSFYSYFSQLRGGTTSSSLIFSESSSIHASDSGVVLIKFDEHDDDMGWFESPLGNTIIIQHEDSFSTVYANLDEETIPETLSGKVEKGVFLGQSGNSSWQDGSSALEFQVLDSKNHYAVNPRILLPWTSEELKIQITGTTLVSREEKAFDARKAPKVPSGTFRIFKDRQESVVPFRTNIKVNGASIEDITTDILYPEKGRLCIKGNSFYPSDEFYPDEKKQLLGIVQITKGRNEIVITQSDIIGNSKAETYIVEAN